MGQGSYTGEYIEYYDNGKIAKKGNLISGKLVGIHQTYYGSNGKLMIETDKKNNIMKMWDKKGNLIYEGEYDSVKSGSFYFDNYYVTDY
jgi:antitoxin component YwqK of YwqJK toxin-antitoxin module